MMVRSHRLGLAWPGPGAGSGHLQGKVSESCCQGLVCKEPVLLLKSQGLIHLATLVDWLELSKTVISSPAIEAL